MASLFWVGGTGTWDGTTNHFATSSGGTATVANPTSSDDVFFDSNSGAGTVTINQSGGANCHNIDFTGSTLTIQSTSNLFPAGNVVLAAGGTYTSFFFSAGPPAGTTKTFTSNGKTVNAFTVNAPTSTGTFQIADTCKVTNAVTLTLGTLDTNGQSCTWGTFSSSNSNTRTLTLGASTITITGTTNGSATWDMTTSTNLTFNAGTSTILFNGSNGGAILQAPGQTFNNLQRVPSTPTGIDEFGIVGDITVTGTLTITGGNATTQRLVLKGLNSTSPQVGNYGVTRTITAAAVALTNVDFLDIAAAGAASPFTGTSLGDGQGNSNITFPARRTLYGVTAGNWSNSATWSLSSGGTTGQSPPLCHDDVNLDSNSGAGTFSVDMVRPCRNLNCTGFGRTLSSSSSLTFFGDITFVAGMTLTLTGSFTLAGRGAQNVTSGGKSLGGVVQFNCIIGSYTLQDNFTTTGASVRFVQGTVNINGKTLTAPTIVNQVPVLAANAPTVNLGGGTITLNGTGTVWSQTVSPITVTGGGIIDITDTSATAKTFAGNGQTYHTTVRHSATGSAGLTITGSNTFDQLDVECSTARTITLPAGGTQTVQVLLTWLGQSGQQLSFVSSSPGTTTTVTVQSQATWNLSQYSLSGDVILNLPPRAGFFQFM